MLSFLEKRFIYNLGSAMSFDKASCLHVSGELVSIQHYVFYSEQIAEASQSGGLCNSGPPTGAELPQSLEVKLCRSGYF